MPTKWLQKRANGSKNESGIGVEGPGVDCAADLRSRVCAAGGGSKVLALPDRDTSLIRNSTPLGPYSRTMPRALWQSWGGGQFFMSEVPLYLPGEEETKVNIHCTAVPCS